MALTREFKNTVQARVKRDAAYRNALLCEAIESFLTGDLEAGKSVLRDYVNATLGFERLGTLMQRSPKSLMRMLGPKGNPNAKNLFQMVTILQRRERVRLEVRSRSIAA